MNNSQLHFVVSAPRSGSTWLTTALNHHPEIFATEHRLFGRFCEIWKNNDGTSAPRITFDSYARAFAMHYFYDFMELSHDAFIEEFQREFAGFLVDFARRRTSKPIVVDKITPYPGTASLVVQQIKKLFPDAILIQLIRDGRDVLTSGTFDWLLKDAGGTERFDFFVNQRAGLTLARFFDDAIIEKWALNWLETISAFDAVSNFTRVTYENMNLDLPTELMRVCSSLNADSSAEVARHCAELTTFEKMSGRAAGVADPTAKARRGVTGDWRNYFTRNDGELFDALAGAALVELNYVPDRTWWQHLPERLSLKNLNP